MISWKFYPSARRIPPHLKDVIGIFERKHDQISSSSHNLGSNAVLSELREELERLGYKVARGAKEKVKVPVLFGENGRIEKSFDVDAFQENSGTVIEVEAGRGVTNNQFLKDFFEACTMNEVRYCVIAVRTVYSGRSDYRTVTSFMDALYASGRTSLPLDGLLLVGY